MFQQYANLYPIMDRFLDLSIYESICDNIVPLSITFGLAVADPNSMPVTRDLSASKRKAILQWLSNLGPDNKPLLGSLPAAAQAAPETEPVAAEREKPGGKLAAIMRIRAAQQKRVKR